MSHLIYYLLIKAYIQRVEGWHVVSNLMWLFNCRTAVAQELKQVAN